MVDLGKRFNPGGSSGGVASFFFQGEDGIRGLTVTGVQTCALPISLYSGLLLNEMTSGRASFRTAIQTGFSFLWAGAQWLYPYFRARPAGAPRLELDAMLQ